MEVRMKKYRHVSPERAKVWTEKSPKYHQNRKVPVIYYLCRNRQLEHPHFMEVQLSSPDGLYLRDVIHRFNALRGRGMASMYSWSCKRSYKSGFVWHDLCEDDLILPAHGNEYVLKGSELFEESSSDHFNPVGHIKVQSLKPLLELPSPRSNDDSSFSPSMNGMGTRHSQEDLSPVKYQGSSDVSPESKAGKNGCLSLTEYKISKSEGSADASTQTEETCTAKIKETCTRGVSTDDGSLDHESNEVSQTQVSQVVENCEIRNDPSPSLSSTASPCSSEGRLETLESLIRADVSKINSLRMLERERLGMRARNRLKASNMLMQLITCGSLSVNDNSFGLIQTYKPRFSQSKISSPFYSTSIMLGELDCLSDNPRLMSFRLEDKEYFSGSLIETKLLKEEREGHGALKRYSSYNADRPCRQLDSIEDKEESSSSHSKCIPRTIKASSKQKPKCESARSPVSDGPRNSHGSKISTLPSSTGSSKRITELSSDRQQSKTADSFREDQQKVIKIEES